MMRFPEFEGEWEESRLGSVCVKIQDGNYGGDYPKPDEFVKEGIPFLTSKAIGKGGVLIEDNVDYISNEKHQLLKKAHLQLNDVLFTNRGANVGAIGFVDERISHGNIGPQLTLFRCKKDTIIPLYLKQIMTSNYVVKQVRSQDSGSAMNFFGIGATSKFKLVFPKLPEQEKIASFLSAVDKKIQQLTAKKELLDQYKKGVMQKIFSQEIRFTDENGKDYPDWEEKKLGDLGCINPRTPELPDKFVYIDLESVAKGRLLKEEIVFSRDAPSRAQRVMRKGDILFQMVRPYQKNNLFFNFDGDYVASTGYAQIRAKEDSMFLYQLLHNQPLVNLIIRSSTGSNYPAINSTDLNAITAKAPSICEQKKIGAFLQNIDKKIESVQNQLAKTQIFKKGLLQQLFV